MARPKNKKKRNPTAVMHNMARDLDRLAEFEQFANEILPALRADLASGKSAEELATKYEALAEARRISMIATSTNESAVMTAIKDLRDRVSGKPKEVQEIEHRLGKLPEEQLDSILESELLTLNEMKGDGE